jgi:hypothetical protein
MITVEQLKALPDGTPVSYGAYKRVTFVGVRTHRENGTAYDKPHVLMRDSQGGEKLVFQSLFCKYATVIE